MTLKHAKTEELARELIERFASGTGESCPDGYRNFGYLKVDNLVRFIQRILLEERKRALEYSISFGNIEDYINDEMDRIDKELSQLERLERG